MNSPEFREFTERSVHAWAEAVEAAGASISGEVAAAVEASLAHYLPEAKTDKSEEATR